MKKLILAAVRAYQRWISPALPTACRYVPTCSDYAMEAIEKNGALRGSAQAAWRVLRCNPFGGSGYDPVCGCGESKQSSELPHSSRQRA